MSGLMLCWGLYVLIHPGLFTDPATAQMFSGMTSIAAPFTEYPALLWGGVAFIVGLARGIALFINGSWTRTPFIRLIAGFVSLFVLTQILIGLWKSGVPNAGLVVYPWLMFEDLLSVSGAAVDAVHAEREREVQKETRRARDRYSSIHA